MDHRDDDAFMYATPSMPLSIALFGFALIGTLIWLVVRALT